MGATQHNHNTLFLKSIQGGDLMSWRSVVITQHAKLSYSSRLMIVQTQDGLTEIPIADIAILVISTTQAMISSALIAMLAEDGVKVIFVDRRHQPVCETNAYHPVARDNQLIMTQCHWPAEKKNTLWTEIVRAKIRHQLAVLENYHRPLGTIQNELVHLEPGDTTNREALVAQQYFKLLFGNFKGRRTPGVINDALNYGYSILLAEVDRAIAQWGYLTEVGIHHRNQLNQFNLGSDLMEPFRPVIDYWIAGQNITALTPDVKYDLIDCVNLVVKFNEQRMSVRNAIYHHVGNCVKYLAGDNKDILMEMEFIYEVPNDALNGHV